MPQQANTYFVMESSGVPDILPAYGQGGKTWTDTTQAQRIRLNILGDKDGTAFNSVTVNVSSGYTGSILIAQFVGVQVIRPRNYTAGCITRSVISCFQSASTLNASATGSSWMSNGTGAAKVLDLTSTYAGSALAVTTPTNRFFMDTNSNLAIMKEPGYLCIEVGIQVAASTTAGTVTCKFGTTSTVIAVANQTGTNDTGMPFFYLSPDAVTQDNFNIMRYRAEGNLSANMGF